MALHDWVLGPSSTVALLVELQASDAVVSNNLDVADFGSSSVWLPSLTHYTQVWLVQASETDTSNTSSPASVRLALPLCVRPMHYVLKTYHEAMVAATLQQPADDAPDVSISAVCLRWDQSSTKDATILSRTPLVQMSSLCRPRA
eukprot:3181897-Alexandrium_andersonii.AAC.1